MIPLPLTGASNAREYEKQYAYVRIGAVGMAES